MSIGVGNMIRHRGGLAPHRPLLQVLQVLQSPLFPLPASPAFSSLFVDGSSPERGGPSLASHGPSLNTAKSASQSPLLQVLWTEEVD